MGENECLGWFPRYTPPKGIEVIPKEEFMKELGVKPHEVEFDIPNCKVLYKDGMIVVDEFTPISEGASQQISKAFEDIRKTMGKDFPMAFTKRKARKHYKPKFTL